MRNAGDVRERQVTGAAQSRICADGFWRHLRAEPAALNRTMDRPGRCVRSVAFDVLGHEWPSNDGSVTVRGGRAGVYAGRSGPR